MTLEPHYKYAAGQRLYTAMHLCDWRDFDAQLEAIGRAANTGARVALPGALIPATDDGRLQRQCAELLCAEHYSTASPPISATPRREGERIRLGYFSGEFRKHPLMYLMAEVLEQHDRERFETFAFSYGPITGGPWQRRTERAVDHFLDVRSQSDQSIADHARQLGIDIAIDLTGLCDGNRLGIFAHRAAPVQAHYLGYVGTTGTPFMDYIIADEFLIPPGSEAFYTEKVAYLPGCFQANGHKHEIAAGEPSRSDHGLPEEDFVFCCFNSSRKYTPAMFEAWMHILSKVPDSVMWLWVDDEPARYNLRRFVSARGIDPVRLIFAEGIPIEEHRKRAKLADLFLDTFPFSAGSTASDTLWCGVPIVTLTGKTFASRMSGSLLNALDLAELITTNVDQYGQTAIELARAPAKLTEIRNRLAAAVREGEVFNAQRSAQRLEDAYTAMYRIAVNKAGPQQSSRSTPLDAGPMSISATCL